MLRLILLRHGESEMNRKGVHQGQLHNSSLSEEGIQQAKDVAKFLESLRIDFIFSSDMNRAVETAKIISKSFGKIEVVEDPRLREYTMGDFDNFPEDRDRLFREFYEKEFSKGISKYEIRPPNGENIWDFIKRISSFLRDIEKLDRTILVVAHGGVNEVLFNLVQSLEKNDFKRYYQDNTCINELVFDNGSWKILSINNIDHLNLIKPDKEVYPNQEVIKSEVINAVSSILKKEGIDNFYLFGSIVENKFGKYNEKFGRHDGSNIDILVFDKNEVSQKWKFIGKRGIFDIYEIGKLKYNGIKHKIDLYLPILNGKEEVFNLIKHSERYNIS
jgi:probable phosphoglycerate mutase